MAFQDEACRWWSRVHLGRVKAPVLIGAICVALLAVGAAGLGAAQAFSTEGFAIAKDEAHAGASSESTSASNAADEKPSPVQVCVFVSGEVAHPAIYYLDEGSRVADAVTAAGGFTDDAATDALNLARTVVDGEQVAVPSRAAAQVSQEAVSSSGGSAAGSASGSPVGGAASSGAASQGARVNINTADVATLQTLNGVGEATAKKIVADREANGPYKTIEDLKRVSGIGDKKFENLRDSICV